MLQAALSNLDIRFIDGVKDSDVAEKAIPKAENSEHIRGPALGSWRGHMNAIQEIVRQNLSSALILEDDVDWDIRLKSQLRDFALSSRALLQPLRATGRFADATYPGEADGTSSSAPELELDFKKLPQTLSPMSSPYGDGWDVLWIGHCGMHFPFKDGPVPKGRVIHREDLTVPRRDVLWTLNIPFTLKEKYPEHTRAVHVQEGVCSLGYAVSRAGARKILRHVALREASDAFDILLRFFCEGAKGRPRHNCLTLQPGLFHHHRPVGPVKDASDIGDHGDSFRTQAATDMVRFSTRLNADVLLEGGTAFIDQYPD